MHIDRQKRLIQSKKTLRGAILALLTDLSDEHFEVFKRVKDGLKVQQIKGTDLHKITVRYPDKKFSRDFANKVADGYLAKVNVKDKER